MNDALVRGQGRLFTETLITDVTSEAPLAIVNGAFVRGQIARLAESPPADVASEAPFASMHSILMSLQIVIPTKPFATLFTLNPRPLRPSRLGRINHRFDKNGLLLLFTPRGADPPTVEGVPPTRPATTVPGMPRTNWTKSQQPSRAERRLPFLSPARRVPWSPPPSRHLPPGTAWHSLAQDRKRLNCVFSRPLEGGTGGTVPFL